MGEEGWGGERRAAGEFSRTSGEETFSTRDEHQPVPHCVACWTSELM